MIVGTSAIVQTEPDSIVNQHTDKFCNPMVMWGKYRIDLYHTVQLCKRVRQIQHSTKIPTMGRTQRTTHCRDILLGQQMSALFRRTLLDSYSDSNSCTCNSGGPILKEPMAVNKQHDYYLHTIVSYIDTKSLIECGLQDLNKTPTGKECSWALVILSKASFILEHNGQQSRQTRYIDLDMANYLYYLHVGKYIVMEGMGYKLLSNNIPQL